MKEESMKNDSRASGRGRGFRWWAGRLAVAAGVLILILGAVTWMAGRSARNKLISQYPAPGQLVDVGGYKMHIYCLGEGNPTIVLEAGHSDFSIHWALVQPEVSRFARVCVYDRAGFGWSEPSPHPRTSETMVKELHTLLVNAGEAKPYILVGHSFGGLNVRLYGHHYPDEAVGIVLVDSVHEEQYIRLPAYREANEQIMAQFRRLALLNRTGIVALFPEKIPDLGLPDEAAAQYGAILATTRYFEASNAEALAMERSYNEFRAVDAVSSPLANLPLIVLSRGLAEPLPGLSPAENEQNEQVWQELQNELVTLSTNSQHVIAEKSGHSIPLQQPELVVESIRQLAQVASADTVTSSTAIAPSPAALKPASPPIAAPATTPRAEPTPTPSPEPTQARPTQVEFTLLTKFEVGRMLFVGVGGDIEGIVSPDLVVSPGTVVRVILVNGDGIAHDVFFPDFDAQSEVIGRKEETTEVTFTVPEEYAEGTYVYYCTRPGHREAGQEGWLIVDRG